MVVARYNAQVAALQRRCPRMRVGTVDKFQDQEAPVVVYSMASSSPEDAPRGMGFLYNPNRLNVATSRAQYAVVLVGSTRLLEPECRTVEHMKWANGLCRFGEVWRAVAESVKLARREPRRPRATRSWKTIRSRPIAKACLHSLFAWNKWRK